MDQALITYVTKPTLRARNAEKKLRSQLSSAKLQLKHELVIAIGGDGTMLHAIHEHAASQPIFLGVSAGRLGFLQTAEAEQIPQLVAALRQRAYHELTAPLLACAQGSKVLGFAFNDMSLERAGPRAAKFDLKIGSSTGSFIGDGVIFATPLGSTAYSLASGGPIIDSQAQDMFIVTPNNPHVSMLYSSLQRPHVLSRGRRLQIAIAPKDAQQRPLQLVIDGHKVISDVVQPLEI
ncbi:MAG: NAD(+)/NADH kinase, partial [Acidobacteriota bacterium]